MKILDRAEIELGTPGSAVRCASVVRNVTDCAALPGKAKLWIQQTLQTRE